MSSEKSLGPREDVSDHDSGAEWIDDMLVVWMEEQAIIDVAYIMCVIPEKPMTALI